MVVWVRVRVTGAVHVVVGSWSGGVVEVGGDCSGRSRRVGHMTSPLTSVAGGEGVDEGVGRHVLVVLTQVPGLFAGVPVRSGAEVGTHDQESGGEVSHGEREARSEWRAKVRGARVGRRTTGQLFDHLALEDVRSSRSLSL